ncbi:MAG TPA: dihydrofolate reductase, partial [Bacteroidales bacterium]|nr:dihydrofolate reductase [Bacteroidales bacterium]
MKKHILIIFCLTLMFTSCTSNQEKQTASDDDFKFLVEQFADLRIMRYQVPDFESLSLKQKELIYYLSEAALAGRDILFDQNYKYNLTIRRTLENIYENYSGPRNTPEFEKYTVYLKRVWFSNGIHHHYSKDKFYPEISEDYFKSLIAETSPGNFPLKDGQTIEAFTEEITPIIFSHNIAPKAVSQAAGEDLLLSSACNFYDGVTEKEAEDYYKAKKAGDIKTGGDTLVSYGLNSKLVKRNGKIFEEVYKTGGLYSPAIEKIIFWLEKAAGVAENDLQQRTINTLIEYYKTGDLKTWDEYNVLWVGDMQSEVDFING